MANDAMANDAMVEFYQEKSKKVWRKKRVTANDDLLELALSDAIIRALESGNKPDEIMMKRLYSEAISDLSRRWRAAKRPQADRGVSVVYDDSGKAVDPFSLLRINQTESIRQDCLSVLAKTMDETALTIFDLIMAGFTQPEIAGRLGIVDRTVRRIYRRICVVLTPIASDIADAIRKQHEVPSFAW